MTQQTITQWLQSLPIPWLVTGPNGRADVTSYGTVLDGQVSLVRQAVLARMPFQAPPDALPHIGGDRQLFQGSQETDDNFRIRLHDAWGAWSRAGQPAEFLTQLYWGGFEGAVLVQQNGIAYSLSGSPTAGVDPTPLLVTTVLGDNTQIVANPIKELTVTITTSGNPGTMQFETTVDGQTYGPYTSGSGGIFNFHVENTSSFIQFLDVTYDQGLPANQWTFHADGTVTASGGASVGTVIISTPWWSFDTNNTFCSRFAVLFPGPVFPTTLVTHATAVFDGSTDTVEIEWNNAFPTSTYDTLCSPATTSGGGVTASFDSSTQTMTGGNVIASSPFTGTVDVLAWQDGDNPFADFHPADLARLRTLIGLWRPASATCVEIVCIAQGRLWGWPVTTWGAAGLAWGLSETVTYSPLGT